MGGLNADLAACKEKAKVSEQEKQQRLKQAKESDAVASKKKIKINVKILDVMAPMLTKV